MITTNEKNVLKAIVRQLATARVVFWNGRKMWCGSCGKTSPARWGYVAGSRATHYPTCPHQKARRWAIRFDKEWAKGRII